MAITLMLKTRILAINLIWPFCKD